MRSDKVKAIPLCKGGWNYHIVPLGSSHCVLCGYGVYVAETKATDPGNSRAYWLR